MASSLCGSILFRNGKADVWIGQGEESDHDWIFRVWDWFGSLQMTVKML